MSRSPLVVGVSDRVHLYFYHTAAVPSPLEERRERAGETPREIVRALDHELPPRALGRRAAGSGRVHGEPVDAGERARALADQGARRRRGLAPDRDGGEAPKRRIAQLGANLELARVERVARLFLRGLDGVVLGMERLGDDAPARPYGFRRRPQEREGPLTGPEFRGAQEPVERDDADGVDAAGRDR